MTDYTRDQRDGLIETCQQAERHVDQAANLLDGAAIYAAMTRTEQRNDIVRLVDHATQLHTAIRHIIARLEAVNTSD